MEPILFVFYLVLFSWIIIAMGDVIHYCIFPKKNLDVFFKVPHQTVGRGMMPNGVLMTAPVWKPDHEFSVLKVAINLLDLKTHV